MKLPAVLTIAGSDSSGGAGIQADLKTITMLGCFGMSAITALTAQNTVGVQDVFPVPPGFLEEQMQSVFSDIPPAAVKIGMVFGTPQISAVAAAIQRYQPPYVVLDPVMVATSGDALLQKSAEDALKEVLFPLAALFTPNLPEAERLIGCKISTVTEMETAAEHLGETYHTAVLIKGGHYMGNCNDLLYQNGTCTWIPGERLDNENTHGTGCTLSSAIAAYLAKGSSLEESVRRGKEYVTHAIRAGLDLGRGHGPIAHNYKILEEESFDTH